MNPQVAEAIAAEQASAIALQGRSFINLADFQARVFLRLESQTDPIDAFVAKEVGNAGLPGQIAGLNAGSQAPRPTLG